MVVLHMILSICLNLPVTKVVQMTTIPHISIKMAWRKADDENYIANHEVISPDASLIVSRRSALDLVELSGCIIDSTYLELPVGGKKNLINNPYNADLMISDLISPEFISEDNQSSFKWFANSQQDKADNIMVL